MWTKHIPNEVITINDVFKKCKKPLKKLYILQTSPYGITRTQQNTAASYLYSP